MPDLSLYDGDIRMRPGEKREFQLPFFPTLGGVAVTLTLAPLSVVLRRDSDLQAVSATITTGVTNNASTQPVLWFFVDTTNVPAGVYRLEVSVTITGTDLPSLSRVDVSRFLLTLA